MELFCHTPAGGYGITVERGAIGKAAQLADLDRKVLVVTDTGVPPAYSDAVLSQCPDGHRFVIGKGEKHKNVSTWESILEEMLRLGFTRKDAVVAVGGGVVGDIAGFAAATYMRGIDFINIPTTLLSQVDSSVGGKTGINCGGVKNSVGAFHYPVRVIIDPDCLSTLDGRLVSEGLAEAIKMAATSDAALFEKIEKSRNLAEDLEDIIASALRIKINVVEQDPGEKGLRKVLNFGHTIGHAIEAAALDEYFHGECVAMGMPCMASPKAAGRIVKLLEKYNLPTRIPFAPETLMPYILHDKKMASGKVTVVYVDKIGSFEFRQAGPEELKCYMDNYLEK